MSTTRCTCEHRRHSRRAARSQKHTAQAGQWRSIFTGPVCDTCATTCCRGAIAARMAPAPGLAR